MSSDKTTTLAIVGEEDTDERDCGGWPLVRMIVAEVPASVEVKRPYGESPEYVGSYFNLVPSRWATEAEIDEYIRRVSPTYTCKRCGRSDLLADEAKHCCRHLCGACGALLTQRELGSCHCLSCGGHP